MIFELIEILLWFIAVTFCFLSSILFFLEYKKRTGFSRFFFRGVCIFTLTYAISRLIENIRRYFIGTYNDIFEAWIRGEQITGTNLLFRVLYIIISWIGIILLYYNIERYIFTNNKYIITFFSIIEAILSILNYLYFNSICFWLHVFIFIIPAYFISILFFHAARNAQTKYVRNGCILTAIGVILFTSAVIIDLPEYAYVNHIFGINYIEVFNRIIAPILIISGLLFCIIGLKTHFQEKQPV